MGSKEGRPILIPSLVDKSTNFSVSSPTLSILGLQKLSQYDKKCTLYF